KTASHIHRSPPLHGGRGHGAGAVGLGGNGRGGRGKTSFSDCLRGLSWRCFHRGRVRRFGRLRWGGLPLGRLGRRERCLGRRRQRGKSGSRRRQRGNGRVRRGDRRRTVPHGEGSR